MAIRKEKKPQEKAQTPQKVNAEDLRLAGQETALAFEFYHSKTIMARVIFVVSVLFVLVTLYCQIFVEGFEIFGTQTAKFALLIAVLKIADYFLTRSARR